MLKNATNMAKLSTYRGESAKTNPKKLSSLKTNVFFNSLDYKNTNPRSVKFDSSIFLLLII